MAKTTNAGSAHNSTSNDYDQTGLTEGYANATASGTTFSTSAHSTGLMFENSVNQQNNDFLTSNTLNLEGFEQMIQQLSTRRVARQKQFNRFLSDES